MANPRSAIKDPDAAALAELERDMERLPFDKQMARIKNLARQADIEHAEDALTECMQKIPRAITALAEDYAFFRMIQFKSPMFPGASAYDRKRLLECMPPMLLCRYADDPLLQLAVAALWTARAGPADRSVDRLPGRKHIGGEHRPLRIGYVSADLRKHPVGYLLGGVFENHDRSRFDVYAYSLSALANDHVTARLRKAVTCWRDLSSLSDEQAAAAIEADEIDILIDLNGHSNGARTGIFARRPAKIQVNWLGYPGSMGSPLYQYMIADAFTIPEAMEDWYVEKIVRLPCYQPNDGTRLISPSRPTRADVGLPQSAFVFCNFGTTCKITRFTFDRWMKILAATPGSVLWLASFVATTEERIRTAAQARGIQPDRIVFAPIAETPEYLARLPLADLFLDTSPYNAHGTASDALWMGLPILTWSGRCFASRVCGSLLTAAGVPELICNTPEEYVSRGIALATEGRAELTMLRTRLAANRDSCLLFDTEAFTRSLESAYELMRDESIAGRRPNPRLKNLGTVFEIGTAIDHDAIEMGAVSGYEKVYAQRFAPMAIDRRTREGW